MKLDKKASTYGLHESLIIPIGAKSKQNIIDYVGEIERIFGNEKAFLVSFKPLDQPNNLSVWQHRRSYSFYAVCSPYSILKTKLFLLRRVFPAFYLEH
jgi:hypothetical protein